MKAKVSERQSGPLLAGPLKVLAEHINDAHKRCSQALRDGLQHALEAGRLLLEAKEEVPHGQWIPWIETHCDFALRTAQAYMKIAKDMPLLDEAKAQRVAHLPFRRALVELAEGASAGGEEKEERRAALRLMENKPVEKVVKMIERGGEARSCRLLPTAAETGWASDGRFLARLTVEEQEQLRHVPKEENYRTLPFQDVLPRGDDFQPLRVLGCIDVPANVFPTEADTITKVGILKGAEDESLVLLVDWTRFDFLRERYPESEIVADSLNGSHRVVFRANAENVGVLVTLVWEDGIPTTAESAKNCLSEDLDALRVVCALTGDRSPPNDREADKEFKMLLELLALLRSTRVGIEECVLSAYASGMLELGEEALGKIRSLNRQINTEETGQKL